MTSKKTDLLSRKSFAKRHKFWQYSCLPISPIPQIILQILPEKTHPINLPINLPYAPPTIPMRIYSPPRHHRLPSSQPPRTRLHMPHPHHQLLAVLEAVLADIQPLQHLLPVHHLPPHNLLGMSTREPRAEKHVAQHDVVDVALERGVLRLGFGGAGCEGRREGCDA